MGILLVYFACLLLLLALPLVLPWEKWLFRFAIFFVAILVILRLEFWREFYLPGSNGNYLSAFVLYFLVWAIFLGGVAIRFLVVAILSTKTTVSRYGDLRAPIMVLETWCRGNGPLGIGLESRIHVTMLFAFIAGVVISWGLDPSSTSAPPYLLAFLDWNTYFHILPIITPYAAVAVLFGAMFCHAPIRWSLGCAIPGAMNVMAFSWIRRFDAGSADWRSIWLAAGLFVLIFCLFAFAVARIRSCVAKYMR